jgi:D-3-phosphoglycerate dehydrogenase
VKVLVSFQGEDEEYAALTNAGHEMIRARGLSREQIEELFQEVDGAISGNATRPMLAQAKNLRAVISPVIGAERIDREAASEFGIIACNSPAPANFEGVAESTVGFIIALNKRMKLKEATVRRGDWGVSELRHMLKGQTVGFVGFGRIARETARRLSTWDMHFIATDPYVSEEAAREYNVELVDLATLLERSDFVSVHVVATPETYKMIAEPELRRMKPNAYFINTSRGHALDEDAFCRAINEEWIAGGALDVYQREPLGLESPLRNLDPDRVILTAHNIAHSVESRTGGIEMSIDNMLRALRGEVPENVLNPEVIPAWTQRFGAMRGN